MKDCSSCGQPIKEDVKFCSHCGEAQVCLSCGREFSGEEKFCGNCGSERGSAANQQVTSQVASTEHPNVSSKPSFNMKKVPWFVWLGGAVIIAIILFFVFKGPDTPEEVVESFLAAFEDHDEEGVKKYMHPSEHEYVDFDGVPDDVKMEIVRFEDVSIEGNEAYVVALVKMSSKEYDMSETDDLEFELEKIDGDWIITDAM